MDYFRHNEKRNAKPGRAPSGTRELIEVRSEDMRGAVLVDHVEMEGRTFRIFRAVAAEDMVQK